jgi:hypothetical protein
VLIAALVLAVLYFALMELILIDSQRALAEANRFRARLVAATYAENAAELAAHQMTTRLTHRFESKNYEMEVAGEMRRSGENFEIRSQASVFGVAPESASLLIQGRVIGDVVKIDYTMHTQ